MLTARHAVSVGTGSDALLPDIDGLADARPWTSREATSIKTVPESLAIIGGGVVATEMATAFAAFGTAVTLISRSGLLSGMEPFAGDLVAEALRAQGVQVILETKPTRVTRDESRPCSPTRGNTRPGRPVTLSRPARPEQQYRTRRGEPMWRRPTTRRCLRSRSPTPRSRPWGSPPRRRLRGYAVRVVDYEIGHVAGASARADGYTGTARMVVDEERKVVPGVTFVGPDVSELLQAATIAVVSEVPLDRLWHAVPAYPTVNEVWLRLLEGYGRPSR